MVSSMIVVFNLISSLSWAQSQASTFYINDTRLLVTESAAAPDLITCQLPDDGIGKTGALFPAQSAKFVWLWASLIGYPAYRPVTIEVIGLQSRQVVRGRVGDR